MTKTTTIPTKKHDGRYITLRGRAGCLDRGQEITGTYIHVPGRSSFVLIHEDGHRGQYGRDEWEVIAAATV